jgi:hypothetical protein
MKLVDVARWLVAEQKSALGGEPTRHNRGVSTSRAWGTVIDTPNAR